MAFWFNRKLKAIPAIFSDDEADIAANQPRRFGLEQVLEKHGVTIQFSFKPLWLGSIHINHIKY